MNEGGHLAILKIECIASAVLLSPTAHLYIKSGDTVRAKREALVRNPRDVIPLTPTNVKNFRRHLIPLVPLLKTLGGDLYLPNVSCTCSVPSDCMHICTVCPRPA